MTLRRKVVLALLAIDLTTLLAVLVVLLSESGGVRGRFALHERQIRERTLDVVGSQFRLIVEADLHRHAVELRRRGMAEDLLPVHLADDSRFWDGDEVAKYVERAVLVRVGGEGAVTALGPLYNLRPRLIFRPEELDRRRLERLVSACREEDRLAVDGDFVATPLTVDGRRFGALCFRLRTLAVSLWDPIAPMKTVLAVVVPAMLVFGVTLYLVLSGALLRPVEVIAAFARRVARRDYSRSIPLPQRNDEIGRLVESFNQMMADVAGYQTELEDRVARATESMRRVEKRLVIAQRLAAMGTLAAGIAHEINNPLGGVVNAVRKLRDGTLPPDRTDVYWDIVEDGLRRIEETVKKVLRSSPRAAAPAPFAVADAARRAQALVAHRLARKSVAVELDVPEDLVIFGDLHELSQVLLNLLINAADAVAPGGRIRISGARSPGGEVVLSVADDGAGMTPEERERAFDLFFTTKEVGEGTGLGLAIVHHIVTAHGGTIDVESEKGAGTTFTLHFPPASDDRS